MNRDFVYNHGRNRDRWSTFASAFSRWLWGIVCCGLPDVPCYFCNCCSKPDEREEDQPRVNQSTTTSERISRPHRPNALRGRKSTPETLSAVRCALSQLQGEPAPPLSETTLVKLEEPGYNLL